MMPNHALQQTRPSRSGCNSSVSQAASLSLGRYTALKGCGIPFLWPSRNEIPMSQLLRFPSSVRRDPAIEVWMHDHSGELGAIAQRWFEVMRDCGDDVRELLHDGHPTACVGDAAFAYVNAFKAHVNVGFFRGAEIADPKRLLEGTGKFMRHVKLRPESDVDATALMKLIETAYTDMKGRLEGGVVPVKGRRLTTGTRGLWKSHAMLRLCVCSPQGCRCSQSYSG
jgi:hypothetical protein